VNQLNKLSMRTMLSESPEWLRNLAFFKRIRNFMVVAPHELLSDVGEEERIKKSSRRIAGLGRRPGPHDQDRVLCDGQATGYCHRKSRGKTSYQNRQLRLPNRTNEDLRAQWKATKLDMYR
jgi:hypothetical protein